MTKTPEQSVDWRAHIVAALSRYWPKNPALVSQLALPIALPPDAPALPPVVTEIELPNWATEFGVDGCLLVPASCLIEGTGPAWQRTDWLSAAGWYLDALAERAHEHRHGPIHSYALRLKGWDDRLWQYAWVNRMALLLRRWAAREHQAKEIDLLGPLPDAEITLTHDVDAIDKTPAIRFKQSVFHCINAARAIARAKPTAAGRKLAKACDFAFGSADYWRLDEIIELEQQAGLQSVFHLYAGPTTSKSFARHLMDPSYACTDPRLQAFYSRTLDAGCEIGLHPSFDAWNDPDALAAQRQQLEAAVGHPVTAVRQHWLRFSWQATWAAQQAAALQRDTTLGFNDRPAFRTGSALRYQPWNKTAAAPLQIQSLPLVFMDSHFYDYANPITSCDTDPAEEMRRWIQEIRFVRGQASVLWHPRTLSPDYGWGGGFHTLLEQLAQ